MSTQDTALDGHFRALDAALKSGAAAGAVITKDVEPYAIAGGVPAKRIGERRRDLNYDLSVYTPMI